MMITATTDRYVNLADVKPPLGQVVLWRFFNQYFEGKLVKDHTGNYAIDWGTGRFVVIPDSPHFRIENFSWSYV